MAADTLELALAVIVTEPPSAGTAIVESVMRRAPFCFWVICHPFLRGVLRGQGVQVHGIGVVPAHVTLVDRLDVVGERAVILAGIPDTVQLLRQLQQIADLRGGVAEVDVMQGLIVDILRLLWSRPLDTTLLLLGF